MSRHSSLTWLVTGCSTGFGRSIAEHLLDQGHNVIATARRLDRLQDLARHANALLTPLDVTDAAQCGHAVRAAQERFGRIDVLVNNAGIGHFAAVEETTAEAARQLMEVNFFGAANAIRAVLPIMRAQRSGHIVNLTSIGGLVGFPAVGFYCASKFALEGLSDTLRQELAPLGIHVMAVEPSGFRTEWAGSSGETEAPIADYDTTAGEARRAYHRSVGRQAGDPARAAAAILRAVTAPRPPAHLLLGNEAFAAAEEKLAALRRDFSRWEEVTRGADFPESRRAAPTQAGAQGDGK
jgi:NAD(P)-dependent dehydrogenase (short-subunit alcohol dehydrogenase family)